MNRIGDYKLGLGLSAVILWFAVAAAHTQDPTAASTAAPITDGKTAFRVLGCAQCHQIHGVGGHKGPDLSGVGRRLKTDAMQKQIVQGGLGMPAFGDALSKEEISFLVKYLKHCRDKKSYISEPMPNPDPALKD